MQEDYLRKGNQLTEDQPVVNHLRIGGQGKFLHDADEDGRHHQHVRQVDRQGGLKEKWFEEGGGKGDQHEEGGRQEGGHHLAQDFTPQDDNHSHSLLRGTLVPERKLPTVHGEQGHILILFHPKFLGEKSQGRPVKV